MRISDWSSDVCSSDLNGDQTGRHQQRRGLVAIANRHMFRELRNDAELLGPLHEEIQIGRVHVEAASRSQRPADRRIYIARERVFARLGTIERRRNVSISGMAGAQIADKIGRASCKERGGK